MGNESFSPAQSDGVPFAVSDSIGFGVDSGDSCRLTSTSDGTLSATLMVLSADIDLFLYRASTGAGEAEGTI